MKDENNGTTPRPQGLPSSLEFTGVLRKGVTTGAMGGLTLVDSVEAYLLKRDIVEQGLRVSALEAERKAEEQVAALAQEFDKLAEVGANSGGDDGGSYKEVAILNAKLDILKEAVTASLDGRLPTSQIYGVAKSAARTVDNLVAAGLL